MKYLRVFYLLSIIACLALVASAQVKQVKKVPPSATTAIDGKTLFGQYCASCHGADGKGSGPVASALKQQPTDLTQMKKRNNGTFPEERFMKIVNGEETLVAHGSADMPIWGPVFRNMTANLNLAQSRIHALMNYIEEMQAK